MKKSGDAKPKPKKDSDIVRERIIRRAALEFQDGMYGILFLRKASFTITCLRLKHVVVCNFVSRSGLFLYLLLYLHLGSLESARVHPSCQAKAGDTSSKFIVGSQRKTNSYSHSHTYYCSQFIHVHVVGHVGGSWRKDTDSVHPERLLAWGLNSQPW